MDNACKREVEAKGKNVRESGPYEVDKEKERVR